MTGAELVCRCSWPFHPSDSQCPWFLAHGDQRLVTDIPKPVTDIPKPVTQCRSVGRPPKADALSPAERARRYRERRRASVCADVS